MSLLTAVDCRGHVHLVVGANTLAAARCSQSIAVGATPVLLATEPAKGALLPAALQLRVDAGEVRWLRTPFDEAHLETLGRPAVDGFVDAVFVTGTGGGGSCVGADADLAERVTAACRRRRIPVNVVDRPDLCSFSLLSTHVDGPLQIGITTNGCGCKLATRIRREIAAALPAGLGAACGRLGTLRRRIQHEDQRQSANVAATETETEMQAETETETTAAVAKALYADTDDICDQPSTFNQLVVTPAAATAGAAANAKTRRIRWLAQMCEYWPLKRLAGVSEADVEALLQAYALGLPSPSPSPAAALSTADAPVTLSNTPNPPGRIILAGSGPGHPDLLTRAVHQAILAADIVLADKLVPQGVLDLIPRRAAVSIARKFPGNADAAQEELIAQATTAARAGHTVLRLKQGDPFVYGRGGEEVLRLRAAGFRDGQSLFVLPGVTSALSAPLFAGIPPTHRDAADQVLICTGTGKKGRPPQPPGYRAPRTAIFLMALHRIAALVAELTSYTDEETRALEKAEDTGNTGKTEECDASEVAARVLNITDTSRTDSPRRRRAMYQRVLWPATTPCTVIERASCPDQRVIRTTLAHVAAAIEQEGSRPPGLLVVGRACRVLHADPDTTGEGNGKPWAVEEGFAGLDLGGLSASVLAGLA